VAAAVEVVATATVTACHTVTSRSRAVLALVASTREGKDRPVQDLVASTREAKDRPVQALVASTREAKDRPVRAIVASTRVAKKAKVESIRVAKKAKVESIRVATKAKVASTREGKERPVRALVASTRVARKAKVESTRVARKAKVKSIREECMTANQEKGRQAIAPRTHRVPPTQAPSLQVPAMSRRPTRPNIKAEAQVEPPTTRMEATMAVQNTRMQVQAEAPSTRAEIQVAAPGTRMEATMAVQNTRMQDQAEAPSTRTAIQAPILPRITPPTINPTVATTTMITVRLRITDNGFICRATVTPPHRHPSTNLEVATAHRQVANTRAARAAVQVAIILLPTIIITDMIIPTEPNTGLRPKNPIMDIIMGMATAEKAIKAADRRPRMEATTRADPLVTVEATIKVDRLESTQARRATLIATTMATFLQVVATAITDTTNQRNSIIPQVQWITCTGITITT
jgi:hypothetical protein